MRMVTLGRWRVPVALPWLVVALTGLLVFGGIADDVEDLDEEEEVDGLAAYDARLHEWMAPRAPAWLVFVATVLDHVGSELPTLILVGAASYVLWRRDERFEAGVLLAAAVLLETVVLSVKALIARPRPENALVEAATFSFPSGHAAFGAFVACAVAWVALRHVRGRVGAFVLLTLAGLWAVAMAASRVIVGVHYLSDVVAGAALGVGVASLALATPSLVLWVRRLRGVA